MPTLRRGPRREALLPVVALGRPVCLLDPPALDQARAPTAGGSSRAVGKAAGGPRLLPNTSPGRTVAGAVGALVLTTALVAGLGHLVFQGSAVDRVDRLVVLGLLVSVPGQLGGLMLSAIKRDAQVKDAGGPPARARRAARPLRGPGAGAAGRVPLPVAVPRPARGAGAAHLHRRVGVAMDDWTLRPARDLGQKGLARYRNPRREHGLVSSVLRLGWWGGVKLWLGLLHQLRIRGRRNLPGDGPFVMVANHASHLDALVLACALPLRLRDRMFPLAAGDVFFETPAVAAFAAHLLNALPVWRRNAGRHGLAELRSRLLEEAAVYLLFPEGGRSRDGRMKPFKPGVGMLVAGTHVPVVPCHLRGTLQAFPPDTRLPRAHPVGLTIGRPRAFPGASAGGARSWPASPGAAHARGRVDPAGIDGDVAVVDGVLVRRRWPAHAPPPRGSQCGQDGGSPQAVRCCGSGYCPPSRGQGRPPASALTFSAPLETLPTGAPFALMSSDTVRRSGGEARSAGSP